MTFVCPRQSSHGHNYIYYNYILRLRWYKDKQSRHFEINQNTASLGSEGASVPCVLTGWGAPLVRGGLLCPPLGCVSSVGPEGGVAEDPRLYPPCAIWRPVALVKDQRCRKVIMVAQSCPALCDPMDLSPPGSSVHRILQARILEWVAIAFSR